MTRLNALRASADISGTARPNSLAASLLRKRAAQRVLPRY